MPDSGRWLTLPAQFRLEHSLDYSFSCTALLYPGAGRPQQTDIASLHHHLKYRSLISTHGNLKIGGAFLHEAGIQYLADSVLRIQPDENVVDLRVDLKIIKNLSLSVVSNLTTRLFSSWTDQPDPAGRNVRRLEASFLTPLVCTFSAGLSSSIEQVGSLTLGVSAGKFTWVRSGRVYDRPGITTYYGVPKGRRSLLEYGLSLQLLVEHEFYKHLNWSCDVWLFNNYRKPADFSLKNLVGIRIGRYLRATIQTRVSYNMEVSRKVAFENQLSAGFFIAL